MNINYFTYITGCASLLGLILQILNVFQKYSKIRNAISFIVFGIFIGSILKAFDSSSIKLNFVVDGYVIIVAIFLIVILTALIIGFIVNDRKRRNGLFTVAGVAFLVFIFVLAVGSGVGTEQQQYDWEKKKLSVEELIFIANENETKHNYDRAIMHLETIKSRLDRYDPRYKAVDERIKALKLKQVE